MSGQLRLFVFLASLIPALTSGAEPIELKRLKETASIAKHFDQNKITVFEKRWDAKKFCNEETVMNPDLLEGYELSGHSGIATLCPGQLDGDENVITLFSKSKPPVTKRVRPLESSHRIEDDVLKKAIEDLTSK